MILGSCPTCSCIPRKWWQMLLQLWSKGVCAPYLVVLSRLVGFWSRVFGMLQTLFYLTVCRDAKFALLHCPIPDLYAPQQKLATYLFISAKWTIAQAWKTLQVAFQGMKSRRTALMLHEQMSSIVNGSHSKFLKIWEPWISYEFPPLQPVWSGLIWLSPAKFSSVLFLLFLWILFLLLFSLPLSFWHLLLSVYTNAVLCYWWQKLCHPRDDREQAMNNGPFFLQYSLIQSL